MTGITGRRKRTEWRQRERREWRDKHVEEVKGGQAIKGKAEIKRGKGGKIRLQ